MQGKLVVFEGIDHVGKSTIVKSVLCKLKSKGTKVVDFQFPGKSEGTLGRLVYDLHHKSGNFINYSVDPFSLQLMHIAAHIDLLNSKIVPSLNAGYTVLLDRFWWSTIAYALGDNLEIDRIMKAVSLEKEITEKLGDTVIFYVDRKNREKDFNIGKDKKIILAYKNIFDNYVGEKYVIENDYDIDSAVDTVLSKLKYEGAI